MAAKIPENIRRFLEKPNVAVLATQSRTGGVHATPVWFLHADGHILINTSRGRAKLGNMRARPDVTLVVVDRENPYRYVQIQGRVTTFDTQNAAKDIDRLSHRYRGQAYDYASGDAPKDRISIHITPERVNAMGL